MQNNILDQLKKKFIQVWRFIWNILNPLGTLITISGASGIGGLIQLFVRYDTRWITWVLVGLFLLSLLFILIILCKIYFKKRVAKRIPGVIQNEFYYSQTKRNLALVFSLLICIVIILVPFKLAQYQNELAQKVIVLVADFENSSNSKEFPVTNKILEKLNNYKDEKHYADIIFQPMRRHITQREGDGNNFGSDFARSEGKKRNASLVLWGSYIYNEKKKIFNVTTHFEVLSGSFLNNLNSNQKPLKELTNAENSGLEVSELSLKLHLSELENFVVKDELSISNKVSYSTLLSIGIALDKAKKYQNAIGVISDAIEIAENSNTKEVNPYAAYFYRGGIYLSEEKFKNAREDYVQVTDLQPELVPAHNNLGLVCLWLNDFDCSISNIEKAITLDEKYATAYNNRGMLNLYNKNYLNAHNDFSKSVYLQPSANAYNNRGTLEIVLKRQKRALIDFEKALCLQPLAITYNNIAYIYLDKFYKEGDNIKSNKYLEKARSNLDKAIKLNPEFPQSYNNLASYYYEKGNIEKSIFLLKKAIDLNPNDGIFYYGLGVAYSEVSPPNYGKAIENYTNAIKYLSENNIRDMNNHNIFHTYWKRGDTYKKIGDNQKAKEDFETVCTAIKDFESCQEFQKLSQPSSLQ